MATDGYEEAAAQKGDEALPKNCPLVVVVVVVFFCCVLFCAGEGGKNQQCKLHFQGSLEVGVGFVCVILGCLFWEIGEWQPGSKLWKLILHFLWRQHAFWGLCIENFANWMQFVLLKHREGSWRWTAPMLRIWWNLIWEMKKHSCLGHKGYCTTKLCWALQ